LKNQNDAKDAVQETAYRAFKSIKNLKEHKYFKTWLIRISISYAIDLLRKQKNIIQLKPELEQYLSDDINKDLDLEITVRDLIERLDVHEKSVIILRFYEDLTIKEVSETLDIPLGTTKTLLYRAINKLRKDWKGDCKNEQ
jgi:RNA polymerase sigma-70 factor (ECF subfamily)